MKFVHAQKDAQSTIQQQSRRIPLCSVLCLLLATCSRAEKRNATCLTNQCFEYGTCNPETDRCECPLGRHGLDCSIPIPDPEPQCKEHSHNLVTCTGFTKTLCLNSCNGQGWCAGGFCHCKPGFYGADCSLSISPDGRPVLLAGQGYMPRQHGVKIYVYELPPVANTWTYIARIDRPLVQVLLQRMLSSGVRTTDGDSADYYFIPLLMRTRTHTVNHLAAVVHYVRKHWPWWDRTGGGHRHLLVAPGDIGRRILTPELLHMTENCTFLTHWGLHRNHSGGNWLASHRPGKDIVVPPLTPPDEPIVYSPLHATLKKNRKPRLGELFFAGRICGDNQKPTDGKCSEKRQDYSAGTRQQVAHHHWNRPNWTITTHTPAYAEALSTHIFCLSPTGGGYGRRSVQSLLMGCIPVTVTDHVHQPFEPEVDWARFSVPVREDDIAQLHHVLTGLRANPHTLAQMQVRLRCAAQHMYYSSTFGEIMGEDGRFDAFETLMEVLRMRKERPELHPRDYEAQDKRFHDFIHCRSKPTGGRVQLCTQNRLVKSNNITHCRESYDAVPMRWMRMFYSWPGGAVCGRNRDVGRCPRSWL